MPNDNFDLDYLARLVQPLVVKADAILLTGSRAVTGDNFVVPSSDYNFIVLGTKSDKASMISARHPKTTEIYEVVVRDPKNYIRAMKQAPATGDASLVFRGVMGQHIAGDTDVSANLKAECGAVLSLGPYPLHPAAQKKMLKRIVASYRNIEQFDRAGARLLGRLTLLNRVGYMAHLLSRTWRGQGKLLGRTLPVALPNFHKLFMDAYETAAFDRRGSLDQPIEALYKISERPSTYSVAQTIGPIGKQHSHMDISGFDGAFHAVRRDPFQSVAFLRNGTQGQKTAVHSWLLWKQQEHRRSLCAGRIGNHLSDEYATAVLSYADFAAKIVLIERGVPVVNMSIGNRMRRADRKVAWFEEALFQAMAGAPDLLNKKVAGIVDRMVPQPSKRGPRPGPRGADPLVA